MTTTKPIAEQVAELVRDLRVGDYVEAHYDYGNGKTRIVTGYITKSKDLSSPALKIDDEFNVTNAFSDVAVSITSITRAPRPIPSEPEVGSFALLDDGDVVQRIGGSWKYPWRKATNQDYFASWEWLYPHITRLYTPSGDLVTGFEYYRAEGN